MIVDHANRVLIGTPAKTGCTSLEFSIRYRSDVPEGLEVVHWPHGGKKPHGLLTPAGCEGYRRYMTVRHPLDRLVSLYYHLRREPRQWSSQEGVIRALPDFGEFASWWTHERELAGFGEGIEEHAKKLSWWLPPNIWMITLGECHRFFKPQSLIHLESYVEDLSAINPYWSSVPHRMKAPGETDTNWRKHYSDELLEYILNTHATQDMITLGYNL